MKEIILTYVLYDYADSFLNFRYLIYQLQQLKKNIKFIKFNLILSKFNNNKDVNQELKKLKLDYSIINVNIENDLSCFYFSIKNSNILSKNSNYIFLNSSCVGPFYPAYINIDKLFELINQNLESFNVLAPVIEFPRDEVSKTIIEKNKLKKIPDSNINIPFFHSYCFMCDYQSLSFLINDKAFPETDVLKGIAVNYYERYLTATLLNNGFKIKTLSLLSPRIISSENIDQWNPDLHTKPWKGNLTCPEVEDNYYYSNLNPIEVMFFKNIRHQGAHRGENVSGISLSNYKFIEKILNSIQDI